MKTIPQIRNELLVIANTANIDDETSRKIKRLVKGMFRRKAARRASAEHAPMTAELATAIRRTARENPDLSYMRIARVHNVSIARVSEVIAGKRQAA